MRHADSNADRRETSDSLQIYLINSKLRPCRNSPEPIKRPRLLKRLMDSQHTPFILLQAPAGYGKTTLMQQYYSTLKMQDKQVAWLRIDRGDCNLATFTAHFKAVIELAGQYNALSSSNLSRLGETNLHSAPLALLKLLQHNEETPVYIFLDDVHHLESSDSVRVLSMLIDHLPPRVHIIMSFRGEPNLSVARQRISGQVSDLAIRDLRFTQPEIIHLLKHQGIKNLSDEQLQMLEQRLEGWGCGLKLVSLLLKRDPEKINELIHFNGERGHFTDYFLHDVFSRQTDSIQNFLLSTAPLAKICAPLCDSIRNSNNSLALLRECEAKGLFLIAIGEDQTWYRYHPLFAQFLKRQLQERDPEHFATINSRASAWFKQSGMMKEAFNHALGGQQVNQAYEIMDQHCDEIFASEENASALVSKLPEALSSQSPNILLAQTWNTLMAWHFETASQLLKTAKQRISELQETGSLSEQQSIHLAYNVQHREMMLAMLTDNLDNVEEQAGHLIEHYTSAHPLVRGSLFTARIYARREHYKLDDLERQHTMAKENLERSGSNLAQIFHQAILGPSRFIAGRTQLAMQSMTDALKLAERTAGKGSALAAVVGLPLSRFYYEVDDIPMARKLLEQYLPYVNAKGFVDQAISGWLTSARISMLDGDANTAFAMLDDADLFAEEHGFERLHLFVLAERLKWLQRLGNTDELIRLGRQHNLRIPSTKVSPHPGMNTRQEARAMAWVRLAQAENRIPEAINLAKQWNHFFSNANVVRSAIRWEVIIVHLLLFSGDRRAAQRCLRRAIFKAASGGFRRVFMDEGPWMTSLLREQVYAAQMANEQGDDFAQDLLTRLGENNPPDLEPEPEPEQVFGSLNSRELEILKMVAAGLLNREIGKTLGMTEGSVKWYLQQIYDKIGVRRRSLAAGRARQLGIIP